MAVVMVPPCLGFPSLSHKVLAPEPLTVPPRATGSGDRKVLVYCGLCGRIGPLAATLEEGTSLYFLAPYRAALYFASCYCEENSVLGAPLLMVGTMAWICDCSFSSCDPSQGPETKD
jgi:hypothetical protein